MRKKIMVVFAVIALLGLSAEKIENNFEEPEPLPEIQKQKSEEEIRVKK